MKRLPFQQLLGVAVGAAALALAGCSDPMHQTFEQQFQEQLNATSRQYIKAVKDSPNIELQAPESQVEKDLTSERRAELDQISGPGAYSKEPFDLGPGLDNLNPGRSVRLSLKEAIHLAVRNNLQVRLMRLPPASAQAQITQALGAFDAVFFSDFNYQNLDTPTSPPIPSFSVPGAGPFTQSKTSTFDTGIRQLLVTGGTVTAESTFDRAYNDPDYYTTPHHYDANVYVNIAQPLLRNFGVDVNRAPIELGISSRDQASQDLRGALLDAADSTEKAYWDLVFARQHLLIELRLLNRTVEDRDKIYKRRFFDTNPIRLTEANSYVELRRADVIRAQASVRLASDQLKQLINSPDLPVSGETLVVPVETPSDLPISFNLLDAVTTALRHRPEVLKALLQIKDASIRQRVADNLRLPKFDMTAGVRFNGNGQVLDSAFGQVVEDRFVDYLTGFSFEAPIGNRAAEGLYTQRLIERQGALVNYQKASQDALLDVKNSLRDLQTTFQLIVAERAARRAAADNLRAIEAQEKAGTALTPEFLLDFKLNTQQRVADAETQEIQALTNYNESIANFFKATGTLLERNGIDFKDTEAEKFAR